MEVSKRATMTDDKPFYSRLFFPVKSNHSLRLWVCSPLLLLMANGWKYALTTI
jgi:hypothetical protein